MALRILCPCAGADSLFVDMDVTTRKRKTIRFRDDCPPNTVSVRYGIWPGDGCRLMMEYFQERCSVLLEIDTLV
eukprot:scaffold1211_cov169-Amphora_coffeaeformis.AAC.30